MEKNTSDFSLKSSYTTVITTAFCCLSILCVVRLSSSVIVFRKTRSKKLGGQCNCSSKKISCLCICSSEGSIGKFDLDYVTSLQPKCYNGEKQTGASMMELLVPEITTHTLSYLDYQSLCRLSMTNSVMRRAANDDNAWKVLYHKDFTVEQDRVNPPDGWKAYYAATRAVVNVNAESYEIIRERALSEMGRFWLKADYVKCVHCSGDLFTGYRAVMQSWHLAFNWGDEIAFQSQDVRARVLSDMAWVTMRTCTNVDTGPFHVSNIYEFHNGQWYMVHHHSSIDVELEN